ncbi:hypothetical protein CW368_00795 [Actinomycetales bacterium SN12]|nr:hypothetical protein CW368_00795 [Actinomycetales bacterium SN12]
MRRIKSVPVRLTFASVAVAALLTGCAPSAVTPEPTGAPVQEQDSARDEFEASYALADCLNEKGWEVTVSEKDGAVRFEGATAQMDQYQADQEECMPDDAPTLADLTDAQWAELYVMETQTAQCLRDDGVAVPEVPSEQVFVEKYQGSEPWTSYSFVGEVAQDRWEELNDICPQPSL